MDEKVNELLDTLLVATRQIKGIVQEATSPAQHLLLLKIIGDMEQVAINTHTLLTNKVEG